MHPKLFRIKSGLSVPDLADLLKVTPRAIYHIEAGRRTPRRAVRTKYREISHGEVTGDDFGAPLPTDQEQPSQSATEGA